MVSLQLDPFRSDATSVADRPEYKGAAMVSSWSDGTALRAFKPSEVATITGVSTDQQRLWAKRYGSDFRAAPGEGAIRPIWLWPGVQQLAAFADIFADLNSAGIALDMAMSAQTENDLAIDLREHPDGDILTCYRFDRPAGLPDGLGALHTTVAGLATLYAPDPALITRPGRVYVYNLSAMQRRIFARASGDLTA